MVHGPEGTFKTLANGKIKILEKIGTGGFCKVHKCAKSIVRTTVFKDCLEEESRPGTQNLALKIFDRQNLRSSPVQMMDSKTGLCRLSSNYEAVVKEINIWKGIDGRRQNGPRNYNVAKIFELIDDFEQPKMYLIMEYC